MVSLAAELGFIACFAFFAFACFPLARFRRVRFSVPRPSEGRFGPGRVAIGAFLGVVGHVGSILRAVRIVGRGMRTRRSRVEIRVVVFVPVNDELH